MKIRINNLKEQLEIVVYYMTNMDKFRPNFWENLKSTKLNGKSEEFIISVSDLIDEYIEIGDEDFRHKYAI